MKFGQDFEAIYPSWRHNLPPTLEIKTRNFPYVSTMRVTKLTVSAIASPAIFLKILSPSSPIMGHNWKHDIARSCFILKDWSRFWDWLDSALWPKGWYCGKSNHKMLNFGRWFLWHFSSNTWFFSINAMIFAYGRRRLLKKISKYFPSFFGWSWSYFTLREPVKNYWAYFFR